MITPRNSKTSLLLVTILFASAFFNPVLLQTTSTNQSPQQAGIFSDVVGGVTNTITDIIGGGDKKEEQEEQNQDTNNNDFSNDETTNTRSDFGENEDTEEADYDNDGEEEGDSNMGGFNSGWNDNTADDDSDDDDSDDDESYDLDEPDPVEGDGSCERGERPYNPVTGTGTKDCGETKDSIACTAAKGAPSFWLVDNMAEFAAEGLGDVKLAKKGGETYCVRGECVESKSNPIQNYGNLPVKSCVYDASDGRNELRYGADSSFVIRQGPLEWLGDT